MLPELLTWLARRDVAVRLDIEAARYLGAEGFAREVLPEGCQLIIVLGGDGTLLSAPPAPSAAATFPSSP